MELNSSLQQGQNNWKPTIETDVEKYYKPCNRRKWEVNYGGQNRVYLTDDERNIFVEAISKGANIVQVGELTLSALVRFIVPVR